MEEQNEAAATRGLNPDLWLSFTGNADNLTALWFFSSISYFGASSVEIWCFQPESKDIFAPLRTDFGLRDEDLMLNVQTNKLKSRHGEDLLRRAGSSALLPSDVQHSCLFVDCKL